MSKCRRIVFIVWLCFLLPGLYVIACQYNVRETGFVDLGNNPYTLVGYINNDVSDDVKTNLIQISREMLSESNIGYEIINVNSQNDHFALKYLDTWQVHTFPAAVLVSPDSQSLSIPILNPKRKFEQSLRTAINEIVSSHIRDQIIEAAIKNYAAVLLINGPNSEDNKKALETVTAAIKHIEKKMDVLPKEIKNPPVLVEMNYASYLDEKILLWSLGIEVNDMKGPYVAVIYGKGRWIGPLFKRAEITKNYLSEILLVIGADCECGLDQEWLQGTMLPARWDKNKQARIAENLGFDPENPMIKSEISRIIRMGSLYQGVSRTSQYSSPRSDSQPGDRLNRSSKRDQNISKEGVSDTLAQEIYRESFFKNSFYITTISLLIIFITGIVIVIRKARK